MSMIRKMAVTCWALLLSTVLMAQEKEGISMADEMRGNGKIYVVVAVLLVIFAGIVVYLIRLDRKMSKLEKDINS
jgi:CcmD family protein